MNNTSGSFNTNNQSPGYSGFNNFQRPSMPAMIPGRLVANADEITPQEVPMDGSVSLFPQNDYSCIYAKTWTKEGTIATLKFVPEQPQNSDKQKSPLEERLDRIEKQLDSLNKKLYRPKNFQKRNNSHPNTEEIQQADVQTAISYLSDEQALTVKDLYADWDENGIGYITGNRVQYNGKLYKCLQGHTSQVDWSPEAAPSIWAEILAGQEGAPVGEWAQPESTNPYNKGDKVTHNEKTWESLVDGNVWEPGAQGSESLWKDVTE